MDMTKEKIDMIIAEAGNLFIDGLLTPINTPEGIRYHMNDRTTINAIIDVITDNGMVYVTTKETMEDLWITLLDADDKRAPIDWLTQNAINWELRAFGTNEEYHTWIQRLVDAYGRFHPDSDIFKNKSGPSGVAGNEDNICADTESIDRLPIDKEYHVLLKSNPWMTYLLTLQMALSRVHKLILGGGDDRQ